MVVISAPFLSDDSGVWHDRTGCPSTYTVHAPHSAIPQPYLVPVSPSVSRRTQSSGVSPCTPTAMSTRSLLTNRMAMAISRGAKAEKRHRSPG